VSQPTDAAASTDADAPLADQASGVPVGALALVLGGIVSVQLGAAVAVTVFDRIGPGGAVALRLVGAALILGLAVRPRLRGRTRRDLAVVVAFGLTLAGMNYSFYEALVRLPLGAAVTIEFLGPLTLAVVLSRRVVEVLWVLLAAGGILLLGRGELSGLNPVGVVLAMTAGALWAAYILLSGATGRRWAGLDGLAAASVVAGLAVLPLGLLGGGSALLDRDILLVGLAVALLSSVVPYGFELVALRRLSTRAFGVLLSLEPAAAALAGLLVLGQVLAVPQVVGITLVAAASAGAALGARRPAPAAPPG